MALNIRDCVSLCLSDEKLKAAGPFYRVSMPGKVSDHVHVVDSSIEKNNSLNHS